MSVTVDLSKLIEKWPSAYVARPEIGRFSGGLFAPGTVANEDCQGTGPEGRIRVGKRVAYEVHALVRWMERRASVGVEKPMAKARRQRKQGGTK